MHFQRRVHPREEKKDKDFDKADSIRQQLLDMNIEIKDTESGTDWILKA